MDLEIYGIALHSREGLYKVFPVEYKRGMPKENETIGKHLRKNTVSMIRLNIMKQ